MRNTIRHSWDSVINVWFKEKCPQGLLVRIAVVCSEMFILWGTCRLGRSNGTCNIWEFLHKLLKFEKWLILHGVDC